MHATRGCCPAQASQKSTLHRLSGAILVASIQLVRLSFGHRVPVHHARLLKLPRPPLKPSCMPCAGRAWVCSRPSVICPVTVCDPPSLPSSLISLPLSLSLSLSRPLALSPSLSPCTPGRRSESLLSRGPYCKDLLCFATSRYMFE